MRQLEEKGEASQKESQNDTQPLRLELPLETLAKLAQLAATNGKTVEYMVAQAIAQLIK